MVQHRKMLFSFWDGGRCHFTRIMALATEAAARGIEIGFITSQKRVAEIRSAFSAASIYVIPNRPANVPMPPYQFPLYSHAFRHAQRLRGLQFDNVRWLQDITDREIAAIRAFNPSVIVNDYRDTIRTAAQVCSVPIVGITHTTGCVDGYTLGWWITPPEDAILPDCRHAFNEVRANYKLPLIVDEREMFSGDITLIPSSPALDPLAIDSGTTFHVGMLSVWKPDTSGFSTIDSSVAGKRVFSYVGEPTRPQYGYEKMLSEVIRREPDVGFYVVGDSSRYTESHLEARRQQGSLIIDHFLPGPTVIEDSAVTVCHGGNGTVMLSLALGKPLICVGPYQSDCSSTFRTVEQQGAGVMLNHSKGALERRPAPDLGEGVEIFGYWRSELNADIIHETISTVINNEQFAYNARRLGDELLSLGGVSYALDLCDTL